METRPLAGLVSCLVSQTLLLLLLHLFQSNPNLLFSSSLSQTLPLLLHLLAASHAASAASAASHAASAASAASASHHPRRRKRRLSISESSTEYKNEEEDEEEEETHQIPEDPTPSGAKLAPRPNPDHFNLNFGMRSSTFEWLAALLHPLIDSPVPFYLPTTARLALALSRLATAAPYPDLAARFSVQEPAARFCARRFCRVLCTNFRFWLAFPSSPDLLRPVSAAFASLGGLHGCCGALASAQFPLRCGKAATFLVADASSRILNFTAVACGDRPEVEALRMSSLYKDAVEGRLLGPEQYLIGDERHQLFPWLMVPFAEPMPESCEDDFNAALHLMCRPARRAVSSLQNWRILSRLREEESTKASVAFIGTCAILHNILLMKEDDSALARVDEECFLSSEQYKDGDEHASDKKAILVRRTLAEKAMAMRETRKEAH